MKRIITLLLILAMLVSCLVVPAYAAGGLLIAPNPNAASNKLFKSLKTSYDPEDYLQLDIKENTLVMSGMLRNPEVKYLCVPFNGENVVITLLSGSRFSAKFDLSVISANELEFSVYTGKSLKEEFISAYYGGDIVLRKIKGEWNFITDKNIYESNVEYMSGWMDEKAETKIEVPDRIRQAALRVTAQYESNYDKARAIHEYVADTLYYDVDYAQHVTPSTYVTAEEVYDKGVSVCEGYANLTIAMLRCVGIPAAYIEGYALGIGSSSADWAHADLTSSNHAWVEAFVDGKWIVLDPTWDSKNTVINGKKNHMTTDFYRYFDITPEMLAATHFVISRPNVFGRRGTSDWALAEAQEAHHYGLITSDCFNSMPDAITRLEFCDLVMNMLSVKLSKSVEAILKDKNVKVNREAFKDTNYYNILAANALGIVNGKEEGKFDPEGTIKRQEAAAMLQRAAVNVLGVEKANSQAIEFTDSDSFANWGRAAISFVSASADKNGRKVMGGKEGGKFAPNDLYTKEQSVLTILRLYTAY